MSRTCELNGTKPATGNLRSHSNIKTRTRWLPNLKTKKYQIPSLCQVVTVTLSARAIKTIDKHGGLDKAIFQVPAENLSEQLLKIRNTIVKKSRKAAPKADAVAKAPKAAKVAKTKA